MRAPTAEPAYPAEPIDVPIDKAWVSTVSLTRNATGVAHLFDAIVFARF